MISAALKQSTVPFQKAQTFVVHIFPIQLLSLYCKTAKREKDGVLDTQHGQVNSHSKEYEIKRSDALKGLQQPHSNTDQCNRGQQ